MYRFTFSSRLLSVLIISSLFLISCEDDPNNGDPVLDGPLVFLNYDASNLTAPQLQGGTYEAAARFTNNETSNLQNGMLTEVYFYIQEAPSSATVKIYKGSQNDFPVELIYSRSATSALEANSWNHHILTDPIALDSEDIWIAIRLQVSQAGQYIGCDPGPGNRNGDWLYEQADQNWERLLFRSNNEANINWNIRGVVDPQ